MRRWLPALLALAGCPPSLDGAPCASDSDCPSSQRCVAPAAAPGSSSGSSTSPAYGKCQDGAHQRNDYVLDSGVPSIDAGPVCPGNPLAGTLTLNGGFSLPDANPAWVDVWDHAPALIGPDGGRPFEPPTIQVAADLQTGAFSVPGLSVGKTYWVSGQYALTFDLDAGDLVDDAVSPPTPYFTGFPPACNLPLDVSTLAKCEVVTAYNQSISTGSYVLDAIADVRDITSGAELTGPVVAQAQVPDAGAAEDLSLTLEDDPTVFDGGLDGGVVFGGGDYTDGPPVYARAGDLPFALASVGNVFTALPGSYAFSVTGTGYKAGSCAVPVSPQTSQPTLDTSTLGSWGDAGIIVTWQSASDQEAAPPGTLIDYYDFILIGVTSNDALTVTWVSPYLPQNTNYHSIFVPLSACPSGDNCTMVIFSSRDVVSSIGANPLLVSREESGAIVPALPTTP